MIEYKVLIRVRNPRTANNPWTEYKKSFKSLESVGIQEQIVFIEASHVARIMEDAGLEVKIVRIDLESEAAPPVE